MSFGCVAIRQVEKNDLTARYIMIVRKAASRLRRGAALVERDARCYAELPTVIITRLLSVACQGRLWVIAYWVIAAWRSWQVMGYWVMAAWRSWQVMGYLGYGGLGAHVGGLRG